MRVRGILGGLSPEGGERGGPEGFRQSAEVNAQKLSRQWQKDGGQYIPNPATWLNQGRWEDEAGPAQAQTNNPFLRQLMEEESHG